MEIKDIKKIHFIGIGGIGVSALAAYFLKKGKQVSGSDVEISPIIQDLKYQGAEIFDSHDKANISRDLDLVVYSEAVPEDNPELLAAKNYNITLKSFAEALGELMKSYYGIAVSGTNGKTTTTAILGLILESADLDPTVILGGKVNLWDSNLRFGESNYFVAEGCEYRRNMLHLSPQMIILTNIEEDHLDYYKNIDDIKDAFTSYVKKLPAKGVLIFNVDDLQSQEIVNQTQAEKISYGLENEADLVAVGLSQQPGQQTFNLVWQGKNLGQFEIAVPGKFNIYNALAASAAAFKLDVRPEVIKEVLRDFKGSWRRFEKVGEIEGKIIISDYAHHPTAVKATIKAAKEFYPDKKILTVFQPHQQDRTSKLFDSFVKSFQEADEIILAEIYQVTGREEIKNLISSKDLAKAVKKIKNHPPISYTADNQQTEEMIHARLNDFDVILIMGAGDIYKIAESLVSYGID